MKTSSPFLWQLIHSLNSSEKLFFIRNYAGFHKDDKTYLKLFSAISSQKSYDEAEIIKKLSPCVNKKNIAYQKHYLQQQICDAIIQYDGKTDAQHDIYNQIQLIRVLRKKGLLKEAHNAWKKTTEKARKIESFALLNLLKTEFEKMVLFSSSQVKYDEMHIIFKKNAITYAEYANLITLRDIYTETILLKRKAHFDIDEDLKKRISDLLEQIEQYGDATISTSFWYSHYYYMSKATLLYINNNIEESFALLKLVLKKWHKNTKFLRTGGEFYVELLYMVNYTGVLQGDYDYVAEAFNHPCNTLISDPVQRANFEVIKFLALNKIYNKTARYNEVEKLIQPMKTAYQQWEPILNKDLNYTTNLSIAIGCFVLEQFNDAMYFAKRAFTYFKTGTREELSAIAQLLLLLFAYNLNNSRLFDAQYRNTYSYFHKQKRKHPFEAALVQCLHRTFYLTDSSGKIREYQKALTVFEQNKDDIVQKMTFKIFNYPGWLTSRIQRISYRRYVENAVKQVTK